MKHLPSRKGIIKNIVTLIVTIIIAIIIALFGITKRNVFTNDNPTNTFVRENVVEYVGYNPNNLLDPNIIDGYKVTLPDDNTDSYKQIVELCDNFKYSSNKGIVCKALDNKLEAERIAKEKAEKERLEAEKREQERLAKEQAKKNSQKTKSHQSVSYNVSELQSYAHQLVLERGWSEHDFECLVKLWNRESGWNPNAHNKSSGAHGIPQALPASKMSSEGSDYYTNGKTQIKWGLKYIANRYGSPASAWNHFQNKNWY